MEEEESWLTLREKKESRGDSRNVITCYLYTNLHDY